MKTAYCILVVSLAIAFPSASAFGYEVGSGNGFVITADVAGPKLMNATTFNGIPVVVHQGEGEVTITITATYTSSEDNYDGFMYLTVGDNSGFVTFTQVKEFGRVTATGTVNLDEHNFYNLPVYVTGYAGAEGKTYVFYTRIWLYKKQIIAVPSGDSEGYLWSGKGGVTVHMQGITVIPEDGYYGARMEIYSIAGETVTPTAGGFSAVPSSASTDDKGKATFHFLPSETGPESSRSVAVEADRPVTTTASWFMSPCTGSPLPSTEATFESGRGDVSKPRRIIVPYATIAEVSGDVRVKNSISGEWMIAQVGCSMGRDDIVFLGPKDPQTLTTPSVRIEFYDGSTGVTTGYYTKSDANLFIKLGDYVENENYYPLVTDVRNIAWDIGMNPIEWGKSALTWGLGKGAQLGLGGYGWIARNVGGELVKYVVRKMDDWTTGSQNLRGPVPRTTATGDAPLDSRVVATMAPADQYGADVFNSYRADGMTDVINRGETRTISDGTTRVILPPWSMVTVDLRGGTPPSPAIPIAIASTERPYITLDPINESTVATLQPRLEFGYAGSVPVMPSTFRVRLNDELVSDAMRVGTTSTVWVPPADRMFIRGENQIRASIVTIHGVTSRALFRLYADQSLAVPDQPNTYPGRASIAVSWKGVRDPALVGYKVFRAVTEEGPGVEISTGVLTGGLFVDAAPLPGANYYRVVGVTASGELTSESPSSVGILNSLASLAAPPAVTGLTATPGDTLVEVEFAKAVGAVGYRIERRAGSGAWSNVLANNALLREPPYIDAPVTNAVAMRYRVTPIGNDGVAGLATEAGPVTTEDLAPAAPKGVTTDVDGGVWVEWNPSREADLLGYHVERGGAGVAFVRLTGSPITARRYFDATAGPGLHAYRVIAVDDGLHESAPSETVSAYIRTTVAPVTPTGFRAQSVSAVRVEISWNAVAGASHYVVQRKSAGGTWQELSAPSNRWLSDTTVAPVTSYLYRVRAVGPAGVSPFTAPDLATTYPFTDAPLTAGTRVKALHLTQLRAAVEAVRVLAGKPPYAFSTTPITGGLIRATDLVQTRLALAEARQALGLPALTFTDAVPAKRPIRAIHIEELRQGVN